MGRDRQTFLNTLALSANKRERGVNQEQPPDTIFKVQKGDILNFGRRAWDEPVMAGGPKHSQRTYYQGNTMELAVNWNEMQPQHLALLAAFCLGDITSVANGGDGPNNGYQHTIKPLANVLDDRRDVPTLTAVQRLGDAIEHRLATSMMVDSVSLSAQADGFCKVTGQLKGTGKTQGSIIQELVTGTNGDTSVTLAVNAVEGADASARLASVHHVFFKLDSSDAWQPVHVQAVSGATPAELTITPPLDAGTDTGVYKIFYMPAAADSLETGSATADPVWDALNETCTLTDNVAAMTPGDHAGRWLVMTSGTASGAFFQIANNTATAFSFAGYQLFEAGVRSGDTYKVCNFGWLPISGLPIVSEPYLRINDVAVVFGGHYDGSSFSGGRVIGRHVQSFEWSYQAAASLKFRAGDREYVSGVDTGDPTQTLKLDREMVDAMHRAMLSASDGESDEAEYFGLQITGTGPVIGGGYTYGFRLTFPKLAIKMASPADGEGKLNESTELSVKDHETHGSVIVEVWNRVAGYAAA